MKHISEAARPIIDEVMTKAASRGFAAPDYPSKIRASIENVSMNHSLLRELQQREVKAMAAEIDRRCRVLLMVWVSEAEPCLVFGPDGMPVGITAKGRNGVSITIGEAEERLSCK